MADLTKVIKCEGCNKEICPREETRVLNGCVWHFKCIQCAKCHQDFSGSSSKSPVCIQGDYYHADCALCPGGCKCHISGSEVEYDEELYISVPSQTEEGTKEAWHCQCYGCGCGKEECKTKDSNLWKGGLVYYMYSPNSREQQFLEKTRHRARRYGDQVLLPRHRECTKCGADMAPTLDPMFIPSEIGCIDLHNPRPKHKVCTLCGECITYDCKCIPNIVDSIHVNCGDCSVCHKKRKISDQHTGRRFTQYRGQIVHTDCIECTRCGKQVTGKHIDAFTIKSGAPTHWSCRAPPKSKPPAKKRKTDK